MKLLTLLALAATISLPMCATSCSWNKADWQRLGTKTLDAALSTGTTEAQVIQDTKGARTLLSASAPSGK